jgi:hypothetical protein
MRADSEILAGLVQALSGTSRNGAHRQRQRHELTNRGHTETTGDLMTGPEHYIAAEELLEDVGHARDEDDAARVLRIAQVHATLALAAVTAVGTRDIDNQAWVVAAGTKLSRPGPEPGPRHQAEPSPGHICAP